MLDVVEQDQTNEAAWFWLYQVFDQQDDKRICLENLITINPNNHWARAELEKYIAPEPLPAPGRSKKQPGGGPAELPPRPVALKLVVAFWTGLSLVFLGSGIIATGNWLISSARTRSFPYYITGFQAFELLVALIFVIAGITGLVIAATLFSRSMAGFYGSIILGLGLLLVGPTVSLVVSPPSYLTMVCTGGISGMIVLLTLASQPGFKDAA